MGNTADRDAFLAKIIAEPDDDNHKLTVTVRVEVLDLWANGATKAEIGRSVGISRRSVQRVIEKMT